TYHKVRQDGRVQSMATVVAIGVAATGERQILGVDAGPSEDRAFWTVFLRGLVKRGLRGVRLVISDAHEGLKRAVAAVLSGTTWQRCRAAAGAQRPGGRGVAAPFEGDGAAPAPARAGGAGGRDRANNLRAARPP